ncbi:ABC transporter ATP-binding protein [Halostagnicola sp. A-GB9-2]|uniref:ABC transporter ATP-binding protein n=1 Tax=Halostagnicola sp. A-GB9-2 TaxID=3048066 RepID=UPI0024C0AA94|nr:ABC transporter ATP-binding protein [Halostagnicola sp. A-GB9-2]MDJ1434842.1 ABC transporter ATP-binding protein [Halostagnicola sp. A-GB9-2]
MKQVLTSVIGNSVSATPAEQVSDTSTNETINATNVSKSYGDEQVLEDLSLSIASGEAVVLAGPNGAGKSTFLSCLVGNERPDSGEISVFGTQSPQRRSDSLAVLLQGAVLIDDLTGRENIEFYAALDTPFTLRWQTYVERFDLEESLDDPVRTYSGGMKRKLELAMTLSVDAAGYILDEPTAGIDLSMAGEMHRTILELLDEDRSVLLTSHNPIDIEIAGRVAFLSDGHITAFGTPSHLIDKLPPVVRFQNRRDAMAVSDLVSDVYYVGAESRGYLEDHSLSEIKATIKEETSTTTQIDTVSPGYSDAFSYYTGSRSADGN